MGPRSHAAPAPGGCGPRVPSRGTAALSPVPEAPEGSTLAVWPGLVAARIQHYNAWQRDQHSPAGARGPAGEGLPPRRSQPQPGPRGQSGAELSQGSRAGVTRDAWGQHGTVSYGATFGAKWGRFARAHLGTRQWPRGSGGLGVVGLSVPPGALPGGDVAGSRDVPSPVGRRGAAARPPFVPGQGEGSGHVPAWPWRRDAGMRERGCAVVPGQVGAAWLGPSSCRGLGVFDLCQRIVWVCLAYLARREIRFSALAPPPFVRRSPARACPTSQFKFRARLGGRRGARGARPRGMR